MQSLFDPVEDIKLPEEKPKREYKKIFQILAAVVVAIGLGIGGYFGYFALFPKKLTERPVPMNMEKLLVELKSARDSIDSETRDIYGSSSSTRGWRPSAASRSPSRRSFCRA